MAGVPRHYATLEVEQTATPDAIKKSYRKLSLQFHPDRAGEAGAAKMKSINEAYYVLSDPKRRAAYDRYGEQGVQAMESDYAAPVVQQFGITLLLGIAGFFVMCFVACLIMLLATVSCKVDGVMDWSWTATLFPVWIVSAFLLIVTVVYLIVTVMNACQDRENSRVTWRNFLPVIPVVLLIASAIMIDINLENARSGLAWFVAFAPLFLMNVIALVQAIPGMTPEAIRTQFLMSELPDITGLDIGATIVARVWSVLSPIVFGVLLAVRIDGFSPLSAWVVAIPLFVSMAVTMFHVLIIGLATMRNGKTNCCGVIQSFIFSFIGQGLFLTTVLLICLKVEGTPPFRTLAVCLVPIFLMVSFLFLFVMFGTCIALAQLSQVMQQAADADMDVHSDAAPGPNGTEGAGPPADQDAVPEVVVPTQTSENATYTPPQRNPQPQSEATGID